MKIVWVLFVAILCSSAVQAQVGKISADGDVSYTTRAKELKYQRSAAPTYEQLIPQNDELEQTKRQQAAPEVLEDEVKADDDVYDIEKKKSGMRLASYGDQREARNIMVVQAVANYKLGDEKLANQFEKVEDNAEFERKMQQIMENLSNNRLRNAKNREAIRILDDAGNKLYNLLAN
jgi:hypothetical protein